MLAIKDIYCYTIGIYGTEKPVLSMDTVPKIMNKRWFLPCLLTAVLACFLLSACGSGKEASATTFELNKDGSITHTIIETVGEEADENTVRSFIEQLVADYSAAKEEAPVRIDSVRKEPDGIFRVQMTYQSIEDYARFNGVKAFNGSMADALSAGFDFSKLCLADSGLAVSGYTLPAEYPDFSVLILQEAMDVRLPFKAILASEDIVRNDGGSYTISTNTAEGIPDVFQSVNTGYSYLVYHNNNE